MSFVTPPPAASIWDQPANSPENVATFTGNPNAVNGTAAPVQVGGSGNTFQTTDTAPGAVNQVVLSGENNQLNVGLGPQWIQTIGGGNIVESNQTLLPDGGKIISIGTLGNGCSTFENGSTVNGTVAVNANAVGSTATIDQMAGGLGGPFQGYAHGGAGDDILYGSCGDDFLRGGQGQDQIFAYDGNDVVRGGAGSDEVWLGPGTDYLYYTPDQLLGGDTDIVGDFVGGQDKLAFDAAVVGGNNNFTRFSGFNTDTLQVTSISGGITTIKADNMYLWQTADIRFVV